MATSSSIAIILIVGAAVMVLSGAGLYVFYRYSQRIVRRYYDELWVPEERLRWLCRRASEFRVLEGEIRPTVAVADLVFSPLSHRACVAWSVTFASLHRYDAQWPGATFSDAVTFDLVRQEGTVRVTHLGILEIPHMLEIHRRYEVEDAREFILSQPNGEEAWRMIEFSRRGDGHGEWVHVYEHVIPAQGYCTLIAGVYDVDPTFENRPAASHRRLSIDAARAFPGTRAEAEAIIRRRRHASLRRNRWLIAAIIALPLGMAGYFLHFLVWPP